MVNELDLLMAKFPKNAAYSAVIVKLQSLALRFFIKEADDFDETQD
jgi:hypothetical protein